MEKEILLNIIKASGLSVADISKKTNVPHARFSEWLKDVYVPKLSKLVAISKKLDLEINIKITKKTT